MSTAVIEVTVAAAKKFHAQAENFQLMADLYRRTGDRMLEVARETHEAMKAIKDVFPEEE